MAEELAGRYRLAAMVGRGGEATVLKAVDIRHERLVALKVRPVPSDEDEARAQLAEARALLSLPAHEGLAHARDDFFESGRHVLVLDWVEGIDLATLLARQGSPGLPTASVLRWVAQAAEAITVLHGRGIVHGDIKPANLVLDRRGRVVVVDLGSSSVPESSGRGAGTPRFRAPEQAAGEVPSRASDVYGLAATAFALLTGSPPAGVLPTWQTVEPNQASVLEAALRAGLAIDPERRPATPGAFVERLRAGSDEHVPSGVMTVLLTDVVGSTERWTRDPAQMPALLAEMQLAVDRAVEQNGGRRVGATVAGGSTISVFTSATSAVRAAVGLQRDLVASPVDEGEALAVRVGLATGEVVSIGDDVVGATVSRAARVRDLAGPGEILLSDTTSEVVGAAPPADVQLVSLGEHTLRGLDGRDDVSAVVTADVAAPPDPARCPFPGLAAFEADDAGYFVGREALVGECIARLERTGFVGLIGGSGTGKSSIVRAGVMPHLPRSVLLTPGEHPMAALAAATSSAPDDAVLAVDQLEEILTLCRNRDDRAAFLDAVRLHPGGAVVALRADLYGELAGFDAFSDLLAAGHLLVGPLRPDELLRVVNEPAARCGLTVEPGLAEVMVGELARQPGMLPLLAHALRETWIRRDGRQLTLAGYRATGGVREAIATTADGVFAGLDESDRAAARELLLGMVELRDDGDDARRWVPLDQLDLTPDSRAAAVLDLLASARLVTIEAARATLAHEALLTAWPALGAWVREERATLERRQQTRRATALWVSGGRSEADLYRGGRLAMALDAAGPDGSIGRDGGEFLEASRDRERRDAVATRRSAQRLRRLLGGVSVLAVAAVVAGALAFAARSRADDERAAADLSRLVALVGATRTDQPDLAMLLAVEAYERADTSATRGALLDALTARPALRGLLQGSPTTVEAVGVSPDGRRYATTSRGTIRLWEAATLAVERDVVTGDGQLFAFDFAEDGSIVAAIPEDRSLVRVTTGGDIAASVTLAPLRVTDVDVAADVAWVLREDLLDPDAVPLVEARRSDTLEVDGQPLRPPQGWISSLAAGSGDIVAMGTEDGSIWTGDRRTGAVSMLVAAPTDSADPFVDFLAWRGDVLVAGRADGAVDVWTVDGRRTVPTTAFDAGSPVRAVAVSGDGAMAAAGTDDGSVIVWDLTTGARRLDVLAHTARVNRIAFTADGGAIITGGYDGKAAVYSLDGALTIARLRLPSPQPLLGTFSPDGERVYAGDADGEDHGIVRLDAGGTRPVWRTAIDGPVSGLSATSDAVIATVEPVEEGVAPAVWVLDAASGRVRSRHEIPGAFRLVTAIAPDGDLVWLAADDPDGATLRSIDLPSGDESSPVRVDDDVTSIAALPDGDRIATGHLSGDVAIRSIDDFEVLARSAEILDDSILTVAINPAGTALAGAGLAGPIHVLDVATMEPEFAAVEGHRSQVTDLAIAADGTLLSASDDGTVRLWDSVGGDPIGGPVRTGVPVAPIVDLHPSGTHALIQGNGGLLELDLEAGSWAATACRVAGRDLTPDERTRSVGSETASPCT